MPDEFVVPVTFVAMKLGRGSKFHRKASAPAACSDGTVMLRGRCRQSRAWTANDEQATLTIRKPQINGTIAPSVANILIREGAFDGTRDRNQIQPTTDASKTMMKQPISIASLLNTACEAKKTPIASGPLTNPQTIAIDASMSPGGFVDCSMGGDITDHNLRPATRRTRQAQH